MTDERGLVRDAHKKLLLLWIKGVVFIVEKRGEGGKECKISMGRGGNCEGLGELLQAANGGLPLN